MSFVGSALYRRSCTASADFRGIEDLCRGAILVSLSQDVLDFVQTVDFFEIARGCTFDVPQPYLAFRRIVEVDWESNGNVVWFSIVQATALFSTFLLEKSRGVSVL